MVAANVHALRLQGCPVLAGGFGLRGALQRIVVLINDIPSHANNFTHTIKYGFAGAAADAFAFDRPQELVVKGTFSWADPDDLDDRRGGWDYRYKVATWSTPREMHRVVAST